LDKTRKDATHIFLDPNHSHFILVEESVSNPNSMATAMRFRSKLETQLGDTNYHEKLFDGDQASKDLHSFLNSHEKDSLVSFVSSRESGEEEVEEDGISDNEVEQSHVHIPMVAICVNGGYDTLKQVQEFLRKNVPVLLLAVIIYTVNS
jgi:hypothetical protein